MITEAFGLSKHIFRIRGSAPSQLVQQRLADEDVVDLMDDAPLGVPVGGYHFLLVVPQALRQAKARHAFQEILVSAGRLARAVERL
jgi:hypothetical protein